MAYKNGWIAADTQETWGYAKLPCQKLFRKRISFEDNFWEVVIGISGSIYSAMLFVSWYDGTDKPIPEIFHHIGPDEDFENLILHPDGVFAVNRFCHPVKVIAEYIAIGSGSKEALAAMKAGKSAEEAVRIASKIDLFSAPPVFAIKGPTKLSRK